MSREEIAKFADAELNKITAQREEAIKAKGGLPYLGKLPVGESRLELQAKIPTDNPGQDGKRNYVEIFPREKFRPIPRKAFVAKKPGDSQEYAWTVNIRSPLYRDLLGYLKVAPVTLRIIRTGEKQADTRYTVKLAD